MAHGRVTIDECVNGALMEFEDKTKHNYEYFLHFAIEFLQKYHRDSARQVKTVLLKLDKIKSVQFPCDYVNWTKIGVKDGDKIKVFTVNNRLALHNDIECGDFIQNQPQSLSTTKNNLPITNTESGYYFYNYTQNGNVGTFFGYGNGDDDSQVVRVDEENSRLLFSANTNYKQILLEYITTGVTYGGASSININLQFCIQHYILYRYYVTRGDRRSQMYFDMYNNEYRIARAGLFGFSIQDILKSTRESFNQVKTGLWV